MEGMLEAVSTASIKFRIVRICANIPWLSEDAVQQLENTLSLFCGMPSLTPIDQATQRREQGDTKSLFTANQSAPSNLASGELCALGRDALGCHCATHVVDSSSGVASEILIEIGSKFKSGCCLPNPRL